MKVDRLLFSEEGVKRLRRFAEGIRVRRGLGRPTDSRPAFSPTRPGQCETDLGFVSQALGKPAALMGAGRCR